MYKFKYKYKLKNYQFTEDKRFPVLFTLEEARTLVPMRADYEEDHSAWLAVRAVRNLAYEGRKFKLGYLLISQKPSNIDTEIGSQCNSLILHQLKNPDDQEYVRKVTEGLSGTELEMLKNIGTGRAVITGTCIRSTVLVEIFKRYSKEGLPAPRPLSEMLDREVESIRQKMGIKKQEQ
jgi:DNA helicase HerA-like ATPase